MSRDILRVKQQVQEVQPRIDGFQHPIDDCIVTAINAEQFTSSLQAHQLLAAPLDCRADPLRPVQRCE